MLKCAMVKVCDTIVSSIVIVRVKLLGNCNACVTERTNAIRGHKKSVVISNKIIIMFLL